MPYSTEMAQAEDLNVVRVGPQGRIVIPVEVRRELNLDEGSVLSARVVDKKLVLEPRQALLERWRGRFKGVQAGVALSDELIADRRAEADADD
jgi:AbrB family looped-hinge helix DNA binding protein